MGRSAAMGQHVQPGRIQPRAATLGCFVRIEGWRILRRRGRGCWALQLRARAAIGDLSAVVHKIERFAG